MGAKCYQFATKLLTERARADLWGISPNFFRSAAGFDSRRRAGFSNLEGLSTTMLQSKMQSCGPKDNRRLQQLDDHLCCRRLSTTPLIAHGCAVFVREQHTDTLAEFLSSSTM